MQEDNKHILHARPIKDPFYWDGKKVTLPPATGEDIWTVLAGDDRPLLVYGMGNGADKMLHILEKLGRGVADFCASPGFVRGQRFHGKTVLDLEQAAEKYTSPVFLVSFGSRLPEVIAQVSALASRYTLLVPDLPLVGEDVFTAAFYRQHFEEIEQAYSMLADETSRSVYASLLRYRLSADLTDLAQSSYDADIEDLLGLASVKCAVDAGAYRGDTVQSLALAAPALEKVYAIEPDGKNYAKLCAAVQEHTSFCLTPVQGATWDVDGFLPFSNSGNRNASLMASGLKTSYQSKEALCPTCKIDTILQGKHVDYIKFDVEGAEAAALRGACRTITGSTPAMLVSAYHRREDIFYLPLLIEEMAPHKYRFYYRRRPCFPGWELDLLCCPIKS